MKGILSHTERNMAEQKTTPLFAYAMKREGQRVRRLEIGVASIPSDGNGVDVYLDRLPIGGFDGRIFVRSQDAPLDEPERPGSDSSE
jgi:hypothetical protein